MASGYRAYGIAVEESRALFRAAFPRGLEVALVQRDLGEVSELIDELATSGGCLSPSSSDCELLLLSARLARSSWYLLGETRDLAAAAECLRQTAAREPVPSAAARVASVPCSVALRAGGAWYRKKRRNGSGGVIEDAADIHVGLPRVERVPDVAALGIILS